MPHTRAHTLAQSHSHAIVPSATGLTELQYFFVVVLTYELSWSWSCSWNWLQSSWGSSGCSCIIFISCQRGTFLQCVTFYENSLDKWLRKCAQQAGRLEGGGKWNAAWYFNACAPNWVVYLFTTVSMRNETSWVLKQKRIWNVSGHKLRSPIGNYGKPTWTTTTTTAHAAYA